MAHTLTQLGKKIVCLGGGIGTVNLIKGLKHHTKRITVVVSAADDGGSAGRLRRLYNIFPPGDAISCLAALLPDENESLANLLTYRFPGNRYGSDKSLSGHKLGNLMFVAAVETAGGVEEGLVLLERLFQSCGKVLPATVNPLLLSAQTVEGLEIKGEQTIDLGRYKGKRVLERVFIHPANPKVSMEVTEAISEADALVTGPGDLYTTILPVLLVPAIKEALLSAKAKKFYIVNVANKPFETKGYTIDDYLGAIQKHLESFPFDTVIVNNNTSFPIPQRFKYTYVKPVSTLSVPGVSLVAENLVSKAFSLYHDSQKLAQTLMHHI